MRVTVTSPTGIERKALIDKDSGVLEFSDGEISHVGYEKSMGKSIFVVKDASKTTVEEKVAEIQKEEAPATEQSVTVQKKKTKKK